MNRPARILFAVALAAAAGGCGAERLVVVSSGDAPPYRTALAGLQKLGVAIEALHVGVDSEPAVAAAVQRAGRDAAIVTLGAKATGMVARHAPAVPVVNCMVIGGADGKPGAATVVPWDVPVDASIGWMKRLLPNARNVGILFDPAHNTRRAEDGAAALKRAGYTPVLEPVPGPSALPSALARLANSVDVLHAIPDTTVFTPEHSRALLLFSFRNRIPLTGPSEAWVKAGALYAVEWDWGDLGRYCGALALRQVPGSRVAPPLAPRTRLIANAQASRQLGIEWDADLLRAMDQVYE